MKHIQMKALDTGRRVQGFLDAHAGVAGVPSKVRERLDDAVVLLSRLRDEQAAAAETARGLTETNAILREELYENFLRPMHRIAHIHLRETAEYPALRILAARIRNSDLIAKANSAATAAAPHEQVMIDNGMTIGFIAALQSAVVEFERSTQERADYVRRTAEATGGLREAMRKLRAEVRLIDALISPAIARDPQLLSGWKASKHFHHVPVTTRAGGGVHLMIGEGDDTKAGVKSAA